MVHVALALPSGCEFSVSLSLCVVHQMLTPTENNCKNTLPALSTVRAESYSHATGLGRLTKTL